MLGAAMNHILISIAIYFTVLLAVVFWISRKQTLSSYFLNSRATGSWMLGCSILATYIGTAISIAVVSETYRTGISVGIMLLVTNMGTMALFALLAPRINKLGVQHNANSMVDIYAAKYGDRNRLLMAAVQLLVLILWIGVQAVGAAALLKTMFGVDYFTALLLTAAVTISYSAIGGLRADIITDNIQFWVFAAVFILLAIAGYQNIDGIIPFMQSLPESYLDPFAFRGGVFFISFILFSSFVCLADASFWQFMLAAKSPSSLRKSYISIMPVLFVFSLFFIFFGLFASQKFPGIEHTDAILFVMIGQLLPNWLAGLGYAGIIAVLMSTIDTLLITGSVIIHGLLFKGENISVRSRKQVFKARLITVLFSLAGFGMAALFPGLIELIIFAMCVAIAVAPSVFALLYSDKISKEACFYSILVPVLVLVAGYKALGDNAFIVTLMLSTAILLLYDKGRKLAR